MPERLKGMSCRLMALNQGKYSSISRAPIFIFKQNIYLQQGNRSHRCFRTTDTYAAPFVALVKYYRVATVVSIFSVPMIDDIVQ